MFGNTKDKLGGQRKCVCVVHVSTCMDEYVEGEKEREGGGGERERMRV